MPTLNNNEVLSVFSIIWGLRHLSLLLQHISGGLSHNKVRKRKKRHTDYKAPKKTGGERAVIYTDSPTTLVNYYVQKTET